MEQARQLIKSTGMIMMPDWDVQSIFIIDQIRKQEDLMFKTEFEIKDVIRGTRFNPNSKTLVAWSLAPSTQKPHLLNIQVEKKAVRMIWNLQNTTDTEVASFLTQVSFMNLSKTKDLSRRYTETYTQLIALSKKLIEGRPRTK